MYKIIKQASDLSKNVKSRPAGDMVLRRIVLAMLVLCMALAYPAEGMAKSRKKQGDESNNKYASIVIDAGTGAILSQRYADKRVHPASLTKVMTLLLLFEAIDALGLKPCDRVFAPVKTVALDERAVAASDS